MHFYKGRYRFHVKERDKTLVVRSQRTEILGQVGK